MCACYLWNGLAFAQFTRTDVYRVVYWRWKSLNRAIFQPLKTAGEQTVKFSGAQGLFYAPCRNNKLGFTDGISEKTML